MGIKGLTSLVAKEAPRSIMKRKLNYYANSKIAFDTNIIIHEFLARTGHLTNDKQEQTGHIQGLLQRTIAFLNARIKPIYVIDGEPPELKKVHELARRELKRKGVHGDSAGAEYATPPLKKLRLGPPPQQAIPALSSVRHNDGARKLLFSDEIEDENIKSSKNNLLKPTWKHFDDCKRLCKLIGVPFLKAPCEGEAQCVHMCKMGQANAVASQDSDCLPFGAPLLLRDVTCNKSKDVLEFNVNKVLRDLKLSEDEFLDFCILCGCDYCPNIEGMGAEEALKLIHRYRSIESILEADRLVIPKNWDYTEARKLFKNHSVIDNPMLHWTTLDEVGLTEFLLENNFKESNVESYIDKIQIAQKSKGPKERRLQSYFKPQSAPRQEVAELASTARGGRIEESILFS